MLVTDLTFWAIKMTLSATVSISWVNTVIAAAQKLGVERHLLLQTAGINSAELAAERWPIDHITRLWRAAERCTGDPGFGLKAGAQVGPASLNVVSFLLQSSSSVREAFTHLQKYQRLISDGGRFQLLSGQQQTWLVYHPCQGELAFSPHQIEAVLAAVIRFISWLTQAPATPRSVQFTHTQLGPMDGYQAIFSCPIIFEQAFNGVLFDNVLLDQTLPQADQQLTHLHEQHAAAQLSVISNDVMKNLPQWIIKQCTHSAKTRAQVARDLDVSSRTLTRRLSAQNTSYERLRDGAKKQLALELIKQPTRSLADIAQTLGYAELSPFYRAFKRWTGQTPARWRKQQTQK